MVVTGVGAVSPVGVGNEFWDSLVAGKSGVVKLPAWAADYPAKVGREGRASQPESQPEHSGGPPSDRLSLVLLLLLLWGCGLVVVVVVVRLVRWCRTASTPRSTWTPRSVGTNRDNHEEEEEEGGGWGLSGRGGAGLALGCCCCCSCPSLTHGCWLLLLAVVLLRR